MSKTRTVRPAPATDAAPAGYRHAGCASEVCFHLHTRDPYQAPRLAICADCGATRTRRQTGATTATNNQWRKEKL